MSLISEQIEEMRWFSERIANDAPGVASLLNKAVDTIKDLSAKLQAVNMERSSAYYSGGWIPCADRLPEEKGWYLVYAKNQRPFVAYFKGKTFPLNNHYHEIVAWMPLPEPYKE